MTASDWLREIAYPFTNGVMLLSMIGFYLLVKLALAAGLFGLWLMLAILPAAFRFLMSVADARIAGRDPEPAGAEMFNWVAGIWTLMPAVLLGASVWAVIALEDTLGTTAAGIALLLAVLALPASIGVLGLTHSALSSVNPVAGVTLIRLCGPGYFAIAATIVPLAGVVLLLRAAGLPPFVIHLLAAYLLVLLYTMTGAVVFASGASEQVDIPDAALPDEETVQALAASERKKILDHAYGLVSRGNRDGGFAHIDAYLQSSPSIADDYRWFFDEMLHWEDSEKALFFAQRYLQYLMNCNEQRAALKLLARCQHVNPRFRPLSEDRQRVLALAREFNREDLARHLS